MSKKGDARINRAVERKSKVKDKSARLLARIEAKAASTKAPRLGADTGSIFHMQMAWTCDAPDCADSWSWGQPRQWRDTEWSGEIEPKLNGFAGLRWSEIDAFTTNSGHKAHHAMDVARIDDEPRDRIKFLALAHDGDIFRFRLGFKKRLWGFRIVNVFEVLWYDPHHMIYRLDPE